MVFISAATSLSISAMSFFSVPHLPFSIKSKSPKNQFNGCFNIFQGLLCKIMPPGLTLRTICHKNQSIIVLQELLSVQEIEKPDNKKTGMVCRVCGQALALQKT